MAESVRIVFLGGLGEIGRNCMAIEYGHDRPDGKILLIDCGLMFPDADMHGIDLVLPDFTYLRANADRVAAPIDVRPSTSFQSGNDTGSGLMAGVGGVTNLRLLPGKHEPAKA